MKSGGHSGKQFITAHNYFRYRLQLPLYHFCYSHGTLTRKLILCIPFFYILRICTVNSNFKDKELLNTKYTFLYSETLGYTKHYLKMLTASNPFRIHLHHATTPDISSLHICYIFVLLYS